MFSRRSSAPRARVNSKSPVASSRALRGASNLSNEHINAVLARAQSVQASGLEQSSVQARGANGTPGRTSRQPTISAGPDESDESEDEEILYDSHAQAVPARVLARQQPPVAGPSQPRPLPASYRPHEGGVQNTSVNIATVMRNHPRSLLLEADTSLDPDTSHDTVPDGEGMQVEGEGDQSQDVVFEEGGAEDGADSDRLRSPPSSARGTKRKKEQKSHPSQPADEISDDSDVSARRKRPRRSFASPNGVHPNGTEHTHHNGIAGERVLRRDPTFIPGQVEDDEEYSEPGEGVAPNKVSRNISRRDYDESSSPNLTGTSYRLREQTDSTSFSQEEEIVDIEIQRRQQQAAEQQRMHEERMRVSRMQREQRERQQMPPPQTPGAMGTPQPPGRYLQTPAPPQNRHGGDADDTFDHGPPPPLQSSSIVSRALKRCLDCLRALAEAPLHWFGKLEWSMLKWVAIILLIAGLFGATTDNRASRGLWRLPMVPLIRESIFTVPSGPPDSLGALMHRLTKLEQSQNSLTSQHSTLIAKRFNDRQESDRRLERLEEAARKVDVAKLEKMVDGLQSGFRELSTDIESDRSSARAFDERLKTTQGEFKAFRDSIGKTMDAARADRLASQISEAIDKLLPARLAVSVNAKTGKLNISEEFWTALRAVFVENGDLDDQLRSALSRQGPGKASSPSWHDWLRSNDADIRRLLDGSIDERIASGAILSKSSFRELLEQDVRSTIRKEFMAGLNDKINDNVEEIGREITAAYDRRQAVLTSRVEAIEKAGTGKMILKTSRGDDIQSVVEDVVHAALNRHSKDVIARADYALYSAGARVVPQLTSATYEARPGSAWQRMLARSIGSGSIRGRPPAVALHHDTAVGSCWSFAGSAGQIGIRLSRSIILDAVVIEHAPAELAIDRSSAPADFEVWGEVTDKQALARLRRSVSSGALDRDNGSSALTSAPPSPNHVRLVAGRYDASSDASSHIQIFDALPAARGLDLPVTVIVLKILGLHGESGFGCLYRVRALGVPLA